MFLIAAETIAKHVTDEDIQKGSLYPPLSVIQECSFDIAIGITKYAYAKGKQIHKKYIYFFIYELKKCAQDKFLMMLHIFLIIKNSGLASLYPEPTDKKNWLKEQLYNFNYETSMPKTWAWPEMPHITTRPLEPIVLHPSPKK